MKNFFINNKDKMKKKSIVTEFMQLLDSYRLTSKDENTKPNYTTINPAGKYFVPSNKEDDFIQKYTNAVFRHYAPDNKIIDDFHIIQLPRELGIVRFDFDFKFPLPEGQNRHVTDQLVNAIIADITPVLDQVYALADVQCEIICSYRPKVEKIGNEVKDGLHLEFPYIVADVKTRHWIHKEVEKRLTTGALSSYAKYGISKIFDKRIIDQAGWLLYGSSKSGVVYRMTRLINFRTMKETTTINERLLPLLLSNHNKLIPNHFKPNFSFPDERKQLDTSNLSVFQDTEIEFDETLAYYWSILDALAPKRSDNYNDWLQVCFCLSNISQRIYGSKHPNFLYLFLKFSKKCPKKYNEIACIKLWNQADPSRTNCPGEARLRKMLKEDVSPERYQEIMRENIVYTIAKQNKRWTPHDVAELFSQLYGNEFRFYNHSNTQNELYHFKNHIWNQKTSANIIVNILTQKFRKELFNDAMRHISNEFHKKLSTTGMTNVDIKKYQKENTAAIAACITDLGKPCFKYEVIKELTSILEDEDFIDKLNMTEHLIAFQNGVFDLKAGIFREGRPSDYISLQCGCDYLPYDPEHPAAKELMQYFKDVLPNDDVRHYFFTVVASALAINKNDNVCYFLQGPGSTGKSTTIKLIQKGFGTYYSSLNIAYFTQKRQSSNSATNEIMALVGRRFICSSETSPGERLNIGIFKDFTGGNTFKGRANYQTFRDINIVGKLFMQVNNMPKLDYVSRAESRRIVIIPFRQIFEDPLSKKFMPDRHKKMDPMIYLKLNDWVPHFMGYLVWHYMKYVHGTKGLIPLPEEMQRVKKEYLETTNLLQSYLDSVLKEAEGIDKKSHKVKKLTLMLGFQAWIKRMNFRFSVDSISFSEYLRENYPDCYNETEGELIGYEYAEMFYE